MTKQGNNPSESEKKPEKQDFPAKEKEIEQKFPKNEPLDNQDPVKKATGYPNELEPPVLPPDAAEIEEQILTTDEDNSTRDQGEDANTEIEQEALEQNDDEGSDAEPLDERDPLGDKQIQKDDPSQDQG